MKKERLFTLLALVVFVALCSYPLFVNLGKLSLRMWDESRNAINAYEMLHDHDFIVTHFNGQPDNWNSKPPLLIWLMAIFMKTGGPTMLAVRLPSALSALACAVFCFWFGKKQLNSRLPGFIAGLVLSSSVGFVDYHVARNGDFDAMLAMWMFFYVIFFFLYLSTKLRKYILLFAFCLTMGILTKGIAACMILPGLFVCALFKEYRAVFKRPEFYILPLSGLLTGCSYYLIREAVSSGYIASVIDNEITGRYLETNEGHFAPWYFYLQLMKEHHYRIWIWIVPIAFLITLFSKKIIIKQLGIFLFINACVYLIIISSAKTKLPWYDAPLYPLFAMITGLGSWTLFLFIMDYIRLKNVYERTLAFCFFCLILLFFPTRNILATSIRAKKETTYPELFYGDFILNFQQQFPSTTALKVISEDYNPHLLFYTKIIAEKGLRVEVLPRNTELKVNDLVMICEQEKMWPTGMAARYCDTVFQEDGNKFVLQIRDPQEGQVKLSPSEKLFYSQVDDIKSNAEWMKGITDKALKHKQDIEKQIQMDALFKLESDNLLGKSSADSIRSKLRLKD